MESILRKLKEIEAQEHVRILYAAESGSRAWQFASEDSDYDVRFIFARPIPDYLRLTPLRDVIELPIVDNLDINGWDLFKALNLFRSSNPPLLEWLYSPTVYVEVGQLAPQLREMAQASFSAKRMAYHYLSMASKQYKLYIADRDEVRTKKYFYVLRPLICIQWLEQQACPPPTSLWDTLDGIEIAHEIRSKLSDLWERKSSGEEIGTYAADPALNGFIETELARLKERVIALPDPNLSQDQLNRLAWSELGLAPSSLRPTTDTDER